MKLLATLQRLVSFNAESRSIACFDRRAIHDDRPLMAFEGDLGVLEELPVEMQFYILSFFSVKELQPLFTVSRKINFMASCNFLWSRFIDEELKGCIFVPERNAGDNSLSNKDLYRIYASIWRWDASTAAQRTPAIEVGDGGRTAYRQSQKGTNPSVMATLPFSKRRNSFEVKVTNRGSWIGIGLADKRYRTLDGSTLGKQRHCINTAFFCQDTTVLQMEGARRAHVEKTIAHRIEVGDRIKVKVDFANNSIAYYRNNSLVGSLRSEKTLADFELFPCVNLSQGSSVTLINPGLEVPDYIAKYGRLPPVM